MDYVRGELEPAETARIEARLRTDPALARERDRLAAFLAATTAAHEVSPDAGAAARVAARVRDRVLGEEDRHAREQRAPRARGRARWARVLAISLGLHVVALGVLSLKMHQDAAQPAPRQPFHGTLPDIWAGPVSDDAEAPALADDDTLHYDTRIRAEEFLPPEDLVPFHLPSADPDAPLAMRDPRLDAFFPSVARSMLFRTIDDLKRVVLAKTGSANAGATLAKVRGVLRFLSGAQRGDGSFPGPDGEPSVKATALALLSFLGDGHSGRDEEYGAVVGRGVEWLKAHAPDAPLSGTRAVALYAMTEDFMLSSGLMTPAERADRAHQIVELARSLAKAPTKGEDAVWTPLSLAAVGRIGLLPAGAGSVNRATRWAGAYLEGTNVAEVSAPVSDPNEALLNGLALLLAPRAKSARFPTFTSWNADAHAAVNAMLGIDGGVLRKHAGRDPTRVETSALVALALELAYRTF